MEAATYIIILLCAGLVGGILGWRAGLFGQTGSILGVAFGVAGVRLLLPGFAPTVAHWLGVLTDMPCPEYFVASIGALLIYFAFYVFFLLCGLILNRLLKFIAIKPFDSVAGMLFGVFKWLFAVSVVYNAMLGTSQDGALLSLTGRGDGNPVELVMDISPTIFGIPSPSELHHRIQLIEARSISINGTESDAPDANVFLSDTYTTELQFGNSV